MTTNFKTLPWRSKPFLAMVKTLNCCACGRHAKLSMLNIPHHYQPPGSGTMGGKIGDEFALALCHWCHMDVHNKGRGEWGRIGVDPMAAVERTRQVWLDMGHTANWLAP